MMCDGQLMTAPGVCRCLRSGVMAERILIYRMAKGQSSERLSLSGTIAGSIWSELRHFQCQRKWLSVPFRVIYACFPPEFVR